jgi:hypothetical protein
MSVVRAQTRRRWLIVGAVVVVLCALPATIAAMPTGSAPIALSTLTARIAASAAQPYQGYAVATGSLGLPTLPALADVATLFDDDTSLRIWYASPQRWRVDDLDTAGERDVYQRDGAQTTWDSDQSQLTTVVGSTPARVPRGADLAPPDLGRRMLAADAPGQNLITSLPARRIAGISAAGLRLTPSDAQTTIGYVDLWADPRTGLPLEVAVTAAGGRHPVLVSRMLQISTTAPAAAITKPPPASANIGATVTTHADISTALRDLQLGPLPATLGGLPRMGSGVVTGIAAYGRGFEQIIAVSVPGRTGFDALDAASAVGTNVPSTDGVAVIVTTPLLTLLVVRGERTADTVIVAGMVTPDLLMSAATQLLTYEDRTP